MKKKISGKKNAGVASPSSRTKVGRRGPSSTTAVAVESTPSIANCAHGKIAEDYLTAELEVENIELRHQVVELALEVADLQTRLHPDESGAWASFATRWASKIRNS